MYAKNFFFISQIGSNTEILYKANKDPYKPFSLLRLTIYHKDYRKSLSEPKSVVLGTFCRSYSYELLEIQLIIMKKFGRLEKNYYLCVTIQFT